MVVSPELAIAGVAAVAEMISDPAAADGAFAAVETSGRATLSQMREVVGALRDESATAPQPVLAQLGSLLERATSADARLRVEGSPRALPGGVDDYLERVRARRAALAAAPAQGPARPGSAAPAESGDGLAPGSAAERAARKELQRLERQIERAAAREDVLHTELAANATDYEKLTELGAELRTVQAERAVLEERWLEAASALEL